MRLCGQLLSPNIAYPDQCCTQERLAEFQFETEITMYAF